MPDEYRVAVRGLPKDVRAIRDDKADKEWFEGDRIAPSDLDDESWEWMLAEGIIEKVGGDG